METLRDIARQSMMRNRDNAITGIMLVQNGQILQVIEGEEAAVRALYQTISRDDRHRDCTILLTRHCEARAFENWEMGFCEADTDDEDLFRLAVASIKARQRQRSLQERRSA